MNIRRYPLPPLEPGDNLDQETFHARYLAYPEPMRAELIGGVVYMPSPLKRPHGKVHSEVITWLVLYKAATPGTSSAALGHALRSTSGRATRGLAPTARRLLFSGWDYSLHFLARDHTLAV